MYEKYHNQGFEILDFPCNQFGHQAEGTNQEIHEFCTLKYKTTFPSFEKIDVNGTNEHPLYTFLKEKKHSLLINKIKWNFTKFLVDRNGQVYERYEPIVAPENIEHDIKKLLQ